MPIDEDTLLAEIRAKRKPPEVAAPVQSPTIDEDTLLGEIRAKRSQPAAPSDRAQSVMAGVMGGLPEPVTTPQQILARPEYQGREGQVRLGVMTPVLREKLALQNLQPGTPEYEQQQDRLRRARTVSMNRATLNEIDLKNPELAPTEREQRTEQTISTTEDRKARAARMLAQAKQTKGVSTGRIAFLQRAVDKAREQGDDIMQSMLKQSSLGTEVKKRTLGAMKGGLSGLTFGISDAVGMEKLAAEANVDPTLAESFANMIGSFVVAGGISKSFGTLLSKSTTLTKFSQLTLRALGTGAVTSGGQNLVQLLAGKKDLPDTIRDTAIGMAAWVLNLAPQYILSSGTPWQKAINVIGQVATDFSYDLSTDAAFTENMKDKKFKDWFVEIEMPRLVNSFVGAASVLKGDSTAQERAQIIQESKSGIQGDYEAYLKSGKRVSGKPFFTTLNQFKGAIEDHVKMTEAAAATAATAEASKPAPTAATEAVKPPITPEPAPSTPPQGVEGVQKPVEAGETAGKAAEEVMPPSPSAQTPQALPKAVTEPTTESAPRETGGEIPADKVTASLSPEDVDKMTPAQVESAAKELGITSKLFQKRQVKDMLARKQKQQEQIDRIAEGPGAATADSSEFMNELTAAKNAVIDTERARRGLPRISDKIRRTNPVAWDEALSTLERNPSAGDQLVKDLEAKPRPVSDTEQAILLHRIVTLQTAYNEAAELTNTQKTPEAYEAFEKVRKALDQTYTANENAGSSWSAAGRFRQVLASERYDLVSLERAAKASKGGAELTPEEQTILKQQAKTIEDLNTKLEQMRKAMEELTTAKERSSKPEDIDMGAIEQAVKKEKGLFKKYDPDGELKKARTILAEGKTLDDTKNAIQRMAKAFYAKGIRDRNQLVLTVEAEVKKLIPNMSHEDVRNAISGYGEYRTPNQEEIAKGFRETKLQLQKIAQLEAAMTRMRRLPTGLQRDKASLEIRKLQKEISAAQKVLGTVETKTGPSLQSQQDTIKARLENRIQELDMALKTGQRITKTAGRQIPMDEAAQELSFQKRVLEEAYAEMFPPQPLSESQRLEKMLDVSGRSESAWIEKLRSAERGEFGAKQPEPLPASAELARRKQTIKAIRDEVKRLREIATPDADRAEDAITRAEKSLKDWQNKLTMATKKVFPEKGKPEPIKSERLDEIRQNIADAQDTIRQLKELAKVKPSPEQQRLIDLKKSLIRRRDRYGQMLERGEYGKIDKPRVRMDEEALKLEAELETVKEKVMADRERWRREQLSRFERTGLWARDIYDAARNIMTTGEMSYMLRQGKWSWLGHPIRTAKALPQMLRSFDTRRAREYDIQMAREASDIGAKEAGIQITTEGGLLTRQEEILMGRLGAALPFVRNFNAAARVFLNRLRLDAFKKMQKTWTFGGESTPEQNRQFAIFANEMTGRGSLGQTGNQAAVLLGRAFFAPRFVASRFQLVLGHSMWKGDARSRAVIASEYARSLTALMLYYGMLKYYFGDDDKEVKIGSSNISSDFGKVVVGNTRIDPLAGVSQAIVLISRVLRQKTQSASGEVRSLRYPEYGQVARDVVSRFAWSKAHPIPGLTMDLLSGNDIGGRRSVPVQRVSQLLYPITYYDMYRALKEQDLDDGVAMAALAFLGEGLQQYDQKATSTGDGLGEPTEPRTKGP